MKRIKKLSELENYIVPQGISKYMDILPVVEHYLVEEWTEETINKCVVEGPFKVAYEYKERERREDFEGLVAPAVLMKIYPFVEKGKIAHRHPVTGNFEDHCTLGQTRVVLSALSRTARLDDCLIFSVGIYRNKLYFYDVKEQEFSEALTHKSIIVHTPLKRLSYDVNKIVIMGAFYKLVEDMFEGHFDFEGKTHYKDGMLVFKHMDVESMLLLKDPELKKWRWLMHWIEKTEENPYSARIFENKLLEITKMYEPDEGVLIGQISGLKETIVEGTVSIVDIDRLIDYMNKVMHYRLMHGILYRIKGVSLNEKIEIYGGDPNLKRTIMGQLSLYNPEYFIHSFDYMPFEYYSEYANRFGHFLIDPYEYSSESHNVSKRALDGWIESLKEAKLDSLEMVDVPKLEKETMYKLATELLSVRINRDKWVYHFNELAAMLNDTLVRYGKQKGIENIFDIRLANLERKE